MSLAQRLKQATPTPSPGGCVTCTWLDTQSDRDRAAFEEWINAGYSRAQLLRECAKEGLTASETSFGRHIRKCMKKQS